MKPLTYVLYFKLLFTLAVWCLPLLVLPKAFFIRFGPPELETLLFLRLLGVAYLSLCLNYLLGLIALRQGKNPVEAIWTGIASNGLACLLLFYYGFTGEWASWQLPGQLLMWISAAITLAITLLLYRYRAI